MGMYSWWFSYFFSSIWPSEGFTMKFDGTLTGGNIRRPLNGMDLDSEITCFSDTLKTSVSSLDSFAINPANGLPMAGRNGGIDIEGNPFGTNFSHDQINASCFNEHRSSNLNFDHNFSSTAGVGMSMF